MLHASSNEGTNNAQVPAVELEPFTDSSNDPSGDEAIEAYDMVMTVEPEQETGTSYEATPAGVLSSLVANEEKDNEIEDKMRYLKLGSSVPHTDNRRFIWFSRFRLLLIAIIILPLLISRLIMLSDTSNITTTTSMHTLQTINTTKYKLNI